jgi:2-polyprenyl-6-methoxyphenol hydroxylase-like FAD-dependent oxidoreductase
MSSPMRSPSELDAPVVIAGAGPVGLVLALELSHHGIRSILVERRPATTTFPKMDVTNARSMELLARLGLADLVRSVGVSEQYSFDVIFCSSLAGREFARWRLPSVDQMRTEIASRPDGSTPAEPWQRTSQAHVEAALMQRCLADELIDVRRPWRVATVEQDPDVVSTMIVHGDTGEECVLRSAYVVGCDGARSQVRASLGIEQEGAEAVAALALVHFRSRDRERLQAHGQFWHVYFATGGVLIAQDEHEVWTLHAMLPPDTQPGSIDPVALVHQVCGVPVQVDEVLEHTLWRPNVLVADGYGSGRVFLAGDACHQVIPTGGYGMNTGLGDAVDLGWKLAAVLDGWGGEALLDSYEVERRPVALRNRDWSFRNLSVHLQVQDRADVALIEEDSDAGARHRAELEAFLTENSGENTSAGIELGYCYSGSPVVASDGVEPPELDPLAYQATTLPGVRAPHVALPDGRSILTWFSDGFTLVDHGASDIERLLDAAQALGIPMRHLALDPNAQSARVYERRLVLVRPDGHVAWRGDKAPADSKALLSHVTGHGDPVATTPTAAKEAAA